MLKQTLLSLLSTFILFGCTSISMTTLNEDTPTISDHFITIAHRGTPGLAPEHTIPSYELAKKFGADYIEIDLQMTKDQVLVALHDNTVDRTTNGAGKVRDYTWEEIKQLNAIASFKSNDDSHYSIPSLEEIFQTFGDSVNYYIETKSPHKYPGMEKELLTLLSKYHLLDPDQNNGLPPVILQSFSEDSLRTIHQMDPTIPLIQLIKKKDIHPITSQQIENWKQYAAGIGVDFTDISKKDIDLIKQHGLLIHVFTINDKKEMERFISYGVDGIFTDHIHLLTNVVENIEEKEGYVESGLYSSSSTNGRSPTVSVIK
jgi:glycerophosphoryl diester phosphodiesterase